MGDAMWGPGTAAGVTLEQATRRFLQEFIFAGSFLLLASFFVYLFKVGRGRHGTMHTVILGSAGSRPQGVRGG
jgi:hypothetical protein